MSLPDDGPARSIADRADQLSLRNRVVDQAPVGVTIADLQAKDQALIYCNAGFERITGYPVEEAVGQNCRFLQGDETDEEAVAQLRAAIEARESTQVELLNYRKDGSTFWNEVTLAPITEDDGSVRYYAGFQQDVTTRKEYEHKLEEQRNDLSMLNQLVRHDIRNDLQLVLAVAETLQGEVDGELLESVDVLTESAEHAVELTETARDVAENILKGNDEPEPVSLPAHLHEQLHDARESYPDAAFELHGTVPEETVLANDLLGSVFENCFRNAVQHNDTDEPQIVVTVSTSVETATVRIADNGPGIPDNRKEAVFGRGEKGPESAGTGIGLYLVHSLVDDYGGAVRIEDNEPRGTVFIIELPLAPRSDGQ